MKLIVKKGRTSLTIKVFIQDVRFSDGRGLSGLAFNSAGLNCYRARDDDGNTAATAITLATMTRGTWASGGLVEKDATNMPGVYEFGVPDNALASGSETVVICLKGAANMAPVLIEIQLVAYDPQDAAAGVLNGVVENSLTLAEVMRGILAAATGKSSGLETTTATYRDNADTKNRITATVDEHGNRSAVTLILTP